MTRLVQAQPLGPLYVEIAAAETEPTVDEERPS
jgi:hypothetical protein